MGRTEQRAAWTVLEPAHISGDSRCLAQADDLRGAITGTGTEGRPGATLHFPGALLRASAS